MVTFDASARRARLVARHLLDGSAPSALDSAASVVMLHATDPATVYLSVLARSSSATIASIAAEMYDQRLLVRMMGPRRTLFVVPQSAVAVVHHGASVAVAAEMRRRLVRQLETLPTDPALDGDRSAWLDSVAEGVAAAIARRGTATAVQLSADERRLRTALLPTTDRTWDVRRTITTPVLAWLGAEGRLVRCEPRGDWRSRAHTWQDATLWWPDGIADLTPVQARAELVGRYLDRFGPATLADIQWWTGWTLTNTRKALAALDTDEVNTGDGTALVLAGDLGTDDVSEPTAALLPALDATPMGWKERGWFLPADSSPFYDSNGNIGPTVWWAGEVVGGWAVRPDGDLAWHLVADRGREAERAVAEAAARLRPRLEGTAVVPSFPTPLEKRLRGRGSTT